MSTTATSPAPSPQPRLEQRILASGLLDLLAGPPGVDGYLEQVRPTWVVRRLPRRGRRRRAPDAGQRHPGAARQSRLGGLSGRPVHPASRVEIDGVAARPAATRPPRSPGLGRELELTVKSPPRGTRLQLPDRAARSPGMVARPRAGRGRLPPSRLASRRGSC